MNDLVQVDGRTGTVSLDMRPGNNYITVIWSDTQTKSKVICADKVKSLTAHELTAHGEWAAKVTVTGSSGLPGDCNPHQTAALNDFLLHTTCNMLLPHTQLAFFADVTAIPLQLPLQNHTTLPLHLYHLTFVVIGGSSSTVGSRGGSSKEEGSSRGSCSRRRGAVLVLLH
jgi:hypothetical protein